MNIPSWLMGTCGGCLHPYPLTDLRLSTATGGDMIPLCAECRANAEAAFDRLFTEAK